MKKLNLLMLAASALLISYYMWNFFVGSRYQALCNVDYWHATRRRSTPARSEERVRRSKMTRFKRSR